MTPETSSSTSMGNDGSTAHTTRDGLAYCPICRDRLRAPNNECPRHGDVSEADAALAGVLRPHRYDCDCEPCVELRTNLAAITEAEREAWRSARDIVL